MNSRSNAGELIDARFLIPSAGRYAPLGIGSGRPERQSKGGRRSAGLSRCRNCPDPFAIFVNFVIFVANSAEGVRRFAVV